LCLGISVRYTIHVLLYKTILITPFVVELGAAYMLAAVAIANAPQVTSGVPMIAPLPREIRLVVIPAESTEMMSPSEVIEEVSKINEIVTSAAPIASAAKTVKSVEDLKPATSISTEKKLETAVYTVPFYSQFSDIHSPDWKKVSCGIASLAMLIDFYSDEEISADALLSRGITAGAYQENAGWIHDGLIGLSHPYGLDGESVSLAQLTMDAAFATLVTVLHDGPVMASVHYTFEPTNPIPHLVVITGVREGKVFYNDPAEVSAAGSLSIEKFEKAWKKRYVTIRPAQ